MGSMLRSTVQASFLDRRRRQRMGWFPNSIFGKVDSLSIAGFVTTNDYSVAVGDVVTLTFTDLSIDVPGNVYQWIDDTGTDIIGETTITTNWIASRTEQPPRIRVTNPGIFKTKVFCSPSIAIASLTVDSTLITVDSTLVTSDAG